MLSTYSPLFIFGLVDFLTTWDALRRGFKDLNPFINTYGLWVYPILLFSAFLLVWFLDWLSSKLGINSWRPSAIVYIVYGFAIINNTAALGL